MKPQLIVALDVSTREVALEVVKTLREVVHFYKVGLELFTSVGPGLVGDLTGQGCEVFLDLKLHDIPNTVAGAVRAATRMGASLVTLHTLGGSEMMAAAREAAATEADRAGTPAPRLLGVTILTSQRQGLPLGSEDVGTSVLKLAQSALDAGLSGVVASVEECAAIKQAFGTDFLVTTPGIRPAGSTADDQKRVATPAKAVEAGSDFLVVGRPVLRAPDPVNAAREILEEMRKANE
jgi:orotidine-5'-phosphate decarboxylase